MYFQTTIVHAFVVYKKFSEKRKHENGKKERRRNEKHRGIENTEDL